MRFSVRDGRWYGRRSASNVNTPDPYGLTGEAHGERNRRNVKELPGGLIREDIGHPLP